MLKGREGGREVEVEDTEENKEVARKGIPRMSVGMRELAVSAMGKEGGRMLVSCL